MDIELEDLLAAYGAEILDCAEEIDPHDCEDWASMAIGWAIANGLSVDEAQDFARRYGG